MSIGFEDDVTEETLEETGLLEEDGLVLVVTTEVPLFPLEEYVEEFLLLSAVLLDNCDGNSDVSGSETSEKSTFSLKLGYSPKSFGYPECYRGGYPKGNQPSAGAQPVSRLYKNARI